MKSSCDTGIQRAAPAADDRVSEAKFFDFLNFLLLLFLFSSSLFQSLFNPSLSIFQPLSHLDLQSWLKTRGLGHWLLFFFFFFFFSFFLFLSDLSPFNRYRKQDLWHAASRGDSATCEAILSLPLDREFNVNLVEPLTKTTALHIACTFGHSLIVKALLADERVKLVSDGNKMSALQTSCLFSRPECVKLFLELRPKSTDSYNAAFTAACQSRSAECARLLADQEETKVHENTALLEYNFKYSDEDSDDEVESLERGFYLACKEGGTKS